ncbi:uncharacterized protein JCM15063_006040 [Sporobolomyces koalae]|uniref:uncharacterized protein n=1 Tax=Sporobolomyces koalae TaxID=500713 RepID=UPI003172A595
MSDVGDIPQGADIAMKSHLPFLLSTCDYVLFGGSHDNGYSQILAGLEAAKQRDKVIILRTTPYCAEKILLLGLNEVRFPLLFEGRDPTERSRPTPSGSAAQAPSLQKLATLATPNTPYASVAARAPSTPASASYVAEVKPDFKPLIRLLLARRSLPVPELRPVWSQIGIDLKELPDCPIEVGKKNEVKAYILGASSVGIVKVGRNQGPGSEWVQLLLSAETAQQRLQASSTAVSKQAADEGTVATYWMLVETLRSQPNYRARLSNLASMVLTQWARFWSKGFRKYIEGARAAGYVQISAVPGDASDIMVELQLRYRPSTSGGTKASPSHPSTFPAKFLPLVEAFSEGKVSTLKAHRLATRFSSGMLNAKLKPFESGKWQEYLDEAEKLGLVTLSKVKGEKQLVTIKGGSTEPPSVAAPTPVQSPPNPSDECESRSALKVTVLLNASVDFFCDDLIRRGEDGGRCAALELKNNVERFLRTVVLQKADRDNLESSALVYFDSDMEAFAHWPLKTMNSFIRGFNDSLPKFDMRVLKQSKSATSVSFEQIYRQAVANADYAFLNVGVSEEIQDFLASLALEGLTQKVILLRTSSACPEKLLRIGFDEARLPFLLEARKSIDSLSPTQEQVLSAPSSCEASAVKSCTAADQNQQFAIRTPAKIELFSAKDRKLFKPLILVLLERLKEGSTKPLRSFVGYKLRQAPKSPIKPNSSRRAFFNHSHEAEKRGLVQLSPAPEVPPGTEWIALKISVQAAKQFVGQETS